MKTFEMDGRMFSKMISGGAENLEAHREVVNDLNVFPIPDGDTGDNMYMTIRAGSTAAEDEPSLATASAKIARGMLLGARGNSGVILSRIFAGIAKGLEGVEVADVRALAKAMQCGVEEAYQAVAVPVEGTILTVFRDAVNYAASNIRKNTSMERFFDNFSSELGRSLERTPELLDVLKEAGVVDSGGAGFVYIAEGMQKAMQGEVIAKGESASSASAPQAVDTSTFTENTELQFGYCTEFLLRLQNSKVGDAEHFDVEPLIAHIKSVGDSVVAFKDGTIFKVHVHTMHPGEILNYAQQYGEFLTLKIENMMLQHHEATIENRFVMPKKHKKYGTLVVCAGAGLKETFLSLGADAVVDGGQSMNPPVEEFLRAFDEIGADHIFVFPNNGNVVLTAKQAAELYEKSEVYVIPTKTVGEGYSAISMLDTSSGDPEAIVKELTEVAAGVVTGIVSRASRDAERTGVTVHNGDYIGFVHDDILVDDPDKLSAAITLAEKLDAASRDVLLILCGESATEEESQSLANTLQEKYKRTEVIAINGGQPVYDFILVLE